jgi:transcription elongation factor GreA
MNKYPITQSGYDKLDAEIRDLKYQQRPRIIEAIKTAREFGDLSENAEYHAAREKQSFIEGRILELEDKFARAEIIDVEKLTKDTIKFGAYVTLIDDETEEEHYYYILSDYEANRKQNKISISSPLAIALIGKSVGDMAESQNPKGVKVYEIIKIEYKKII